MLQAILAFLATVLTAVQSLLLYTEGKIICFNSGCEIIESLTTVPPLVFNLFGFVFFFMLFWCFYLGRTGSEYWLRFAKLLLMAGLVAEAVLLFFQYKVAKVYCPYCLTILALVVLLNLLCGMRQIFRSVVLCSAVLLACFSLQFNVGGVASAPLSEGVIARLQGESDRTELHLFFSKSCVYCEKVIDTLRNGNQCSVAFNPIENMDDFVFSGATFSDSYDPAANLGFLKSLSLTGIPVLVTKDGGVVSVLSGGDTIQSYLEENCLQSSREQSLDHIDSMSAGDNSYTQFLNPQQQGDDNCSVDEECKEVEQLYPVGPSPN